jgi:hypothetical protein
MNHAPDVPYDIRSVFTKMPGEGPTYLKTWASDVIKVETGLGVYAVDVTLTGGPAGAHDDMIAYDWWNQEFVRQNAGTLHKWDDSGAYAGSESLPDWVGQTGTIAYTEQGCYLTYDQGGDIRVYSWNADGSSAGGVRLIADAHHYSFSYANGWVWIWGGDKWEGFNVGI